MPIQVVEIIATRVPLQIFHSPHSVLISFPRTAESYPVGCQQMSFRIHILPNNIKQTSVRNRFDEKGVNMLKKLRSVSLAYVCLPNEGLSPNEQVPLELKLERLPLLLPLAQGGNGKGAN